MTEESKAVKRAKRWERNALDRATRAYAAYLRAVEYRKLAEAQDEIVRETDELKKRIEASVVLAETTVAQAQRVLDGMPILSSQSDDKK